MKRSTSTKSLRRKLTRKDIIKVSIFAVIALIIAIVTLNQLSHYQDKQKFVILKQDILTLRTEFDKVNPGWKYIEGCNASGAKYQQDVASYCYLTLESKADISSGRYVELVERQGAFKFNDALPKSNNSYSLDVQYLPRRGVRCTMGYHDVKHYFECSDSALDFYFPKTQ